MARVSGSCELGGHLPSTATVRLVANGGPVDQPVRRCRRCGQLLVKSPITQRWRVTGVLG